MKKIYINRQPEEGPWGGGNNFVKAMYMHMPKMGFSIVSNPVVSIPDVIFLQSPLPDNKTRFSINEALFLKQKFPQIKIILRVNDCDARKGTSVIDNMWIQSSSLVDKTVFVSNWMKNYFIEKGWQCKDNSVLYNGVNLDHFSESEKIKNGKINIVTHHWSDNRMKGFDIYEELDDFVGTNDRFTFSYIGRELGTFKNTKVIKPLFGSSLGSELSKFDVYVSASKSDPGPNHILESLACKIPTYVSAAGGGCIEFAGKDFVFDSFEDLRNILMKEKYNINNTIKLNSWKVCIENLLAIIKAEDS